MARLETSGVSSALVMVLTEPDGHAMWSVHPTTGATFEVLGAYGLPLNGYTSGAPWVLDAFHGEEMDRDDQVQHLGARHLALRDGLWMQPEPLLHLGLTNGDLRNPIGFSGLYAAGNSNALQDQSGLSPSPLSASQQLQMDIASAATGPSMAAAKPEAALVTVAVAALRSGVTRAVAGVMSRAPAIQRMIWTAAEIAEPSGAGLGVPAVGAAAAAASRGAEGAIHGPFPLNSGSTAHVVETAAAPKGATTVGASSLQKKLSGGAGRAVDSAFSGTPTTTEAAQGVVQDVLTSPTAVTGGAKTVDVYSAAGQGVLVDTATGDFVTFTEESLRSR